MGAGAAALVLTFLFVAAAAAVPDSIEVPEGHRYRVQQRLHARGDQLYRFNGTAWENFNATARLYTITPKSRRVGRHFYLPEGLPTWESGGVQAVPYSRVTCTPLARAVVDPGSIPWVLLERTQSSGDESYFGAVEFVQRINTRLGLAPGSTQGARVRDVKRSPYTADYVFYVPVPKH